MIFIETKLPGAYHVKLEKQQDERGFFARSWCCQEFESQGLNPGIVQCNISFNEKRGTLRGMHYQLPPFEEAKLVRCTMGALYDVMIDLRKDSPTYLQWAAFTLTAENRDMLYIPEGFAHGFQTLSDKTEVFYQMTEFYHPECAAGVRWDDPLFDIEWLVDSKIISQADRNYKDFLP